MNPPMTPPQQQVELVPSSLAALLLEFLSYSTANINLQIYEDVGSEDRAVLDSSLSLQWPVGRSTQKCLFKE